MLWVLWVHVTFTAACLCLPPTTTTSQVRSYATEEACRQDLDRTRDEFEAVGVYLDALKVEMGETPAPMRLLPEQRTYAVWCAPGAKGKEGRR